MKHTLLTAILSTALLHAACAAENILRITSPEEGAEVGTSSEVSGTVSDPKDVSEIWVVCHLVGSNEFWVQCQATVSSDDPSWKGNNHPGGSVRFASDGTAIGREFEIIAVADPEEILTRGQLLDGCPKARLTSVPVKVKKTKE